MTNNRRIIHHTDNHYDIEEYKPVLNELGEPFGYVWAVTFCSEEKMNGYTPTIEMQTRVNNLLEQIPQEYRARACRECYGTNDFDFERKLTGYVLGRTWETYEHPVNEAEFVDGFCDERLSQSEETDKWLDRLTPHELDIVEWLVSDEEKAADEDWQDEQATRADLRTGFQQF